MSFATQYRFFDDADCQVKESSVPTSIAVLVIALTASELVILGLCKMMAWYADVAFYSQDWSHDEQTRTNHRNPEAVSQSLRTQLWTPRDRHSAEEPTCPICLVDFGTLCVVVYYVRSATSTILLTICPWLSLDTNQSVSHGRASCHHTFHTECITQWLSKQSSCPCCRQDMIVPPAWQRDSGFCFFAC